MNNLISNLITIIAYSIVIGIALYRYKKVENKETKFWILLVFGITVAQVLFSTINIIAILIK